MLLGWLSGFLFGQAVEAPIYERALRRDPAPGRARLGLLPRLAVAFAATSITHPIVWFLFPRLVRHSYAAMALAAEGFAVAVEALWLAAFGLRPRRALLWSLVANAASCLLGLASRACFGWP